MILTFRSRCFSKRNLKGGEISNLFHAEKSLVIIEIAFDRFAFGMSNYN